MDVKMLQSIVKSEPYQSLLDSDDDIYDDMYIRSSDTALSQMLGFEVHLENEYNDSESDDNCYYNGVKSENDDNFYYNGVKSDSEPSPIPSDLGLTDECASVELEFIAENLQGNEMDTVDDVNYRVNVGYVETSRTMVDDKGQLVRAESEFTLPSEFEGIDGLMPSLFHNFDFSDAFGKTGSKKKERNGMYDCTNRTNVRSKKEAGVRKESIGKKAKRADESVISSFPADKKLTRNVDNMTVAEVPQKGKKGLSEEEETKLRKSIENVKRKVKQKMENKRRIKEMRGKPQFEGKELERKLLELRREEMMAEAKLRAKKITEETGCKQAAWSKRADVIANKNGSEGSKNAPLKTPASSPLAEIYAETSPHLKSVSPSVPSVSSLVTTPSPNLKSSPIVRTVAAKPTVFNDVRSPVAKGTSLLKVLPAHTSNTVTTSLPKTVKAQTQVTVVTCVTKPSTARSPPAGTISLLKSSNMPTSTMTSAVKMPRAAASPHHMSAQVMTGSFHSTFAESSQESALALCSPKREPSFSPAKLNCPQNSRLNTPAASITVSSSAPLIRNPVTSVVMPLSTKSIKSDTYQAAVNGCLGNEGQSIKKEVMGSSQSCKQLENDIKSEKKPINLTDAEGNVSPKQDAATLEQSSEVSGSDPSPNGNANSNKEKKKLKLTEYMSRLTERKKNEIVTKVKVESPEESRGQLNIFSDHSYCIVADKPTGMSSPKTQISSTESNTLEQAIGSSAVHKTSCVAAATVAVTVPCATKAHTSKAFAAPALSTTVVNAIHKNVENASRGRPEAMMHFAPAMKTPVVIPRVGNGLRAPDISASMKNNACLRLGAASVQCSSVASTDVRILTSAVSKTTPASSPGLVCGKVNVTSCQNVQLSGQSVTTHVMEKKQHVTKEVPGNGGFPLSTSNTSVSVVSCTATSVTSSLPSSEDKEGQRQKTESHVNRYQTERNYRRQRSSGSSSSSLSRSPSPVLKRNKRNRSSSSSRSRSPVYKRNCRRYQRSRSRSRSEERRYQRRFNPKDDDRKAKEERRVVFVGGIPAHFTKTDLVRKFEHFGEIISSKVVHDTTRDRYGFLTFVQATDAVKMIREGSAVPGCEDFQFSYGGRRQYCIDGYADLDDEYRNRERRGQDFDNMDFSVLLRKMQEMQKKDPGRRH